MQTFLTSTDFRETAQHLDEKRLGKQRTDAKKILMCLLGEGHEDLKNHATVKLWKGHEQALAWYGLTMCDEWINRGHKDETGQYFVDRIILGTTKDPDWTKDESLISSHRATLLTKDFEHYSQLGWEEKPL